MTKQNKIYPAYKRQVLNISIQKDWKKKTIKYTVQRELGQLQLYQMKQILRQKTTARVSDTSQ